MSGVEIRVRSNSKQARDDLKKLEQSVGNIETATQRMASAFKTAAVTLGSALVTGKLTKGFITASDAVNQLANRVSLVTGRGKELQGTLVGLYAIAARSRTSVGTVTETFNRFSLALKDSGKSADDILRVTEAVGKASVISGASAESAKAAIIQLGQGLASGELRGEELNSVLEQTPRIAQAIATGMGIPFGKLRELAKDGQITAEAVFNALLKQAPKIEEEFALIKPTIQDLTVVMRDEFTRALAEIDGALGFSDNVANRIRTLTEVFRYVADDASYRISLMKLAINDFSFFVSKIARDIGDAFSEMFKADFDFTKFKEDINSIVEEVKKFLGFADSSGGSDSAISKLFEFQIKTPNYSSFTAGLSGAVGIIQHFAQVIKDTFDGIYSYVFANSPWPDMFNEKGILSPEWKQAMDNFVNGILVPFKDNVIGKFNEMYNGVKNWFTKIRAEFSSVANESGGDYDAFGVKSLSENFSILKSNIDGLTTSFTTLVGQSTAWQTSADFTASRYEAAAGFINGIKADFAASETTSGFISNYWEKMKENSGEAAANMSQTLKDFMVGPNYADKSFIGPLPEGQEIGKFEGALGKVMDNSGLLLGASGAAAFAYAFPNATAGILEYAGLGLALAFANGLAWALSGGLPITLAVVALAFPDTVANIVKSETFQNMLHDIAFGITEGLKSLFSEGSEGNPILEALGASIRSVGAGIVDSIFGEDFKSDFTERFAGAAGIAIATLVIGGILKNGIIGFAGKVVGAFFKATAWTTDFGAKLEDSIAKGVDSANTKIDSSGSKIGGKLAKIGGGIAKGIGRGFNAAFIASAAGEAIDTLAGAEEGGLLDAGTNVLSAGATGAAFGSAFGPMGAAVGGAIGLFTGAMIEVFTNPELLSSITSMGDYLMDNVFTPFADGISSIWDKINNKDTTAGRIENLTAQKEAVEQRIKDLETGISDGTAASMDALTDYQAMLTQEREDLSRLNKEISSLKAEELVETGKFVDGMVSLNDDIRKLNFGQLTSDTSSYLAKLKREERAGSDQKFASGGYISGPGGPTDDLIPAMLSNGEFVMRASAVKKFGPEFMAKINAGIMPQMFSTGGIAARIEEFKNREANMIGKVESYRIQRTAVQQAGDTASVRHFDNQITLAQAEADKARTSWEALQGELDRAAGNAAAAGGGGGGKTDPNAYSAKAAKKQAEGFASDIKNALAEGLKSGDLKGAFKGILDSFTSRIIDTFVDGMVDNLLGEKGMSFLTKIFKGAGSFGKQVGSTATEGVTDQFAKAKANLGGEGGLGALFKNIGGWAKGLFSGVSGALSGLFGGGGMGSLFGAIGGFLGFADGGVVPSTPYSRPGLDSVPAMLTPGELVVPADKVDQFVNGAAKGNSSVFNINITGDVSRLTRKEVAKMIPEITAGVNMTNKERRNR